MTLLYLVENLEGGKEKGKAISLEELKKLDRLNVYNVKACEGVSEKERIGVTPQNIQIMVDSRLYKEIYMVEVYNRMASIAGRLPSVEIK